MTTNLIPFAFDDHLVRVVDVDGEPWFVAKDVCSILGIANHSDALSRLDEDEKGVGTTDTLGGPQQVAIISEPGAWSLAMTSRKPTAKPFVRWLSHDVVPAIRTTGTYTAPTQPQGPATTDVALMAPEAILALAQRLVDTTQRAEHAEQQAQASQRVVRAIEATDGITLTAFHKHYFSDVTERTFFEFLYARGLLINQRGARGRGPDGRLRDGREHRHPSAKGKRYLYLHGVLDREGVRREHVRVRPGAPEVELVRFLYHRGLTPNENAVAVIEGTGLVEVV